MTSREQKKPSVRVIGRKTAVAAIAAAAFVFVPQASAFEIFGWAPFGDKTAEETPEPLERLPYAATLTLTEDDGDLKSALETASVLVSRGDDPPPGAAALIARARTDRKRLIAALYANGRYGGTVDIRIGGTPLDRLPIDAEFRPDAEAGGVPVEIAVRAGPEFQFDDVRILADKTASGADVSADPSDYGLTPGGVAGSKTIVNAGEAIVAEWRNKGHALATVTDREIVADHARKTIDVTYYVAPGPPATFGDVSVRGADRMEPDFILKMAAIQRGRRYDPKELKKAEKRLRDLGVFDGVRIHQAEQLNADGSLPLTIEVAERKRRFIGAGATYSNTEGAAVELYWGHRNLFGRAERIRIDGSVGRISEGEVDDMDYSVKLAFAKPGVFGPATEFTVDLFAIHEEPDAFVRSAAGGAVGVTYRIDERLTAKAGLSFERSEITDTFGRHDYLLAGVPVSLAYDARDNKLDPTQGFFTMVSAEPLYDLRGDHIMFLTEGTLSAYQAVDAANRLVLAGRVSVGSALGADLVDIPANRRYYVGGGNTIRGYGYQNVGPHRPNGDITGGLSYFVTSAELRTRVTDTVGLVGFVDAGNAYSERFPDFADPLKVGVGAGVRYLTPIGPIRLDVAVPLDKRKDDPDFGIYVGIGQAF